MVTKKEPNSKPVVKPTTRKAKVVTEVAAKKPVAVKKEAVKPKAKPTPKPVPKKVVEKAIYYHSAVPELKVKEVVTPTKPLGVMERMFRYIANILS